MTSRAITSKHDAGVSLVEMLVALMIVALASVMVVMTLPRKESDPLERSQEQIRDLLAAMPQEAIASGRAIGLSVDGRTVRVVAWQQGAWTPLPGRALELEPRTSVLIKPGTKRPKNWPAVSVDEMGLFSPASIVINAGAASRAYRISASGLEGSDAG
ncbi:MAG: GspH/FimT family pseudopilin [Hyphomonas sp.]